MNCSNCSKYIFKYQDILYLAPRQELEPTHFSCPKCKFNFRITRASRYYFICLLLICIFPPALLNSHLSLGFSINKIFGFVILAIVFCYLVLWPKIIEVEKWAPYKCWLPNSRIVGYSVYLILPILFVLGLFYISVNLR